MELLFRYGELVNTGLFVNRTEERKRLAQNFKSGLSTMLISSRRWGKSSLVRQVAKDIANKKVIFCFIDLFYIKDEEEFYQTLAKEVIQSTSTKMEEWMSLARNFLQKLSPKISVGIDPLNDFEISFDEKKIETNYKEILDLANKIATEKKIRIVICVDEFQNLSRFGDPLLFQQRLRASWQHHHNVSYCLYGSKKHMMLDIFENKNMPFYKFGDMMFLEKISTKHWVRFIRKQFKSSKKEIDITMAESIVNSVKNHSYYVQQLSHLVWVRTDVEVTQETLNLAINDLLAQNSILFNREIEHLSNTQISFLEALVGGEEKFHSSKVIAQYKLGSSSNVTQIKDALEKKEIIDTLLPQLEFIDPIFEFWLKERYFKKKH